MQLYYDANCGGNAMIVMEMLINVKNRRNMRWKNRENFIVVRNAVSF